MSFQGFFDSVKRSLFRAEGAEEEWIPEYSESEDAESKPKVENQDAHQRPALPMKVESEVELFDRLAIEWEPSDVDQIYAAFDVAQPANSPENLSGREEELGKLLSSILYRRNHAIIAGPRGSGKTSLVRVLSYLAEKQGANVIYNACGVETPFGQLFRELLEQVPYSLIPPEKADLFEQRVSEFDKFSNVSEAVKALSLLKYSQLIMIVDEFDRIEDEQLLASMAAVMKLISDRRLPVRMVLAGSENTFREIVAQHSSLIRNLTEVATNPLTRDQISKLLEICGFECEMFFAETSKDLIYEISCGSPYHARLFGMQAALSARHKKSGYINNLDVDIGLAKSFEEWSMFNREDARIFKNIMDGYYGNPNEICSVAKALARGKVGESPLEKHPALDDNRPKARQNMVAAFGNSLLQEGKHLTFRDTTAPQFLLALQHTRNCAKGRSRSWSQMSLDSKNVQPS